MTKPYFDSSKQFSSIIKNVILSQLQSRGFDSPFIISNWKDICGEFLFEKYSPSKISTDRMGQKVLWLKPADIGCYHEFHYYKKDLLDRINFKADGEIKEVKVLKPF